MATMKQLINEIDVVELLDPFGGWPAGTNGTVVHDFGNVKMVEISDERGETLDLPSIPLEKLRLVARYG